MTAPRDPGPLNQGGPSDPSSPRPDAREAATQGSQSGQPKRQEESPPISPGPRPGDPVFAAPSERATAKPGHPSRERAASGEPDEPRGVSETERQAGTPDPHATTDASVGQGPGSPGR